MSELAPYPDNWAWTSNELEPTRAHVPTSASTLAYLKGLHSCVLGSNVTALCTGPFGPQIVEHPGGDLFIQPIDVVDGVIPFRHLALLVGGTTHIHYMHEYMRSPQIIQELSTNRGRVKSYTSSQVRQHGQQYLVAQALSFGSAGYETSNIQQLDWDVALAFHTLAIPTPRMPR